MKLGRAISSARRLVQLALLAWAGRRLSRSRSEADRQRARAALAALFRQARGMTMKVGQLWSGFGGEASTDEQVIHAEPLPFAEIEGSLNESLGRSWREVFSTLDEACAAASLGQVHRGRLRDGRLLALKVRYPGITAAVEAELALAGLVPGAGPVKRFGFDVGGYRRVLRQNMLRELDYRSEAARQERFRRGVTVTGLAVPTVLPELCREDLLVQSFEAGVSLTEASTWPRRDRLLLGRTLLATLLKSLFIHGEVHGDPNPGNYLFRRTSEGKPEVVLLDFGCMLEIPRERRLALLSLILGCREATPVDALASFSALGFDAAKLEAISDKLPALAQLLFEPFLLDRALKLEAWQLGARADALLGELRWWFRSAGPPDLLLALRAFQGLVAQLETLHVALPFWPVLREAVGEELLTEARAFQPAPLQTAAKAAPLSSLARLLKVAIHEGLEPVVELAMPAAEVAHLEEQVPEEIRTKITEKGIDLPQTVAGILAAGIRPQEVFALEDGARRLRVWLE